MFKYFTDCWKSTAIMSTNAVSFLLLKKFRNGTTLKLLADDLSILCDKLSQANRDIGFSGNSKDVVKHAVSINDNYIFISIFYKFVYILA